MSDYLEPAEHTLKWLDFLHAQEKFNYFPHNYCRVVIEQFQARENPTQEQVANYAACCLWLLAHGDER